MGVLDSQSIRLSNRKVGKRRLEKRQSRRRAAPSRDRRRPGRGANVYRTQDQTVDLSSRRRLRTRARITGAAGALGRFLAVLILLPVQILLVLLRPVQLVRRLREAPSRMKATTRRLRMASRDPESRPGRVWETARLSAWFVREEFVDMQDGFPRPADVARSAGATALELAIQLGRKVGALPTDERDDVRERLFHAASTGFIGAAVVVGLFMASYHGIEAMKTSDRLAVREVQIIGLDRVSEAELTARLGAGVGDNLLELEPERLAGQVRDLDWVEDVTVSRTLGDGVLQVRVVERRPALLLAAGGLQLVDDQGVAFKTVGANDPVDLPVIALDPSASDQERADAAAGALEVLRALTAGRALTQTDVSEIRYDADDGFTLVTRAGLPVRLGRRDFADRLGRLERAVDLGSLPLDALAEVDLGLRDRLVAVPLTTRTARRQIRERIEEQPIDTTRRRRMLHLQRITAALDEGEVDL
jgi:cell division septal protein FtsQ